MISNSDDVHIIEQYHKLMGVSREVANPFRTTQVL